MAMKKKTRKRKDGTPAKTVGFKNLEDLIGDLAVEVDDKNRPGCYKTMLTNKGSLVLSVLFKARLDRPDTTHDELAEMLINECVGYEAHVQSGRIHHSKDLWEPNGDFATFVGSILGVEK